MDCTLFTSSDFNEMYFVLYLYGKGLSYDGNGNRRLWMMPDDMKTRSGKINCFIDKINDTPVPGTRDLMVLYLYRLFY